MKKDQHNYPQAEDAHPMPSAIIPDLSQSDELRKAFIASEILKLKY